MQAAQLTHTGIEVVPIVTGQFLTARTHCRAAMRVKMKAERSE